MPDPQRSQRYLALFRINNDTFSGDIPELSVSNHEARHTVQYSEEHVSVQLLMAKSTLAPLKRPTMPRLELLACMIGALDSRVSLKHL